MSRTLALPLQKVCRTPLTRRAVVALAPSACMGKGVKCQRPRWVEPVSVGCTLGISRTRAATAAAGGVAGPGPG